MTGKTSYLEIADAEAYFAGRLNTDAWDNATVADRTKALVQASTDIDKLNYIGEKSDDTQEHEFPRTRADNTGVDTLLGMCDTDNVPYCVKYAVCEQALALLDGFLPDKEIDNLTVTSQWYGGVRTIFDRGVVPMHLKVGLCAIAWQFLSPFFRDPREISVLKV